jgi:branched-chain amino acid transport system substrate-binding protein
MGEPPRETAPPLPAMSATIGAGMALREEGTMFGERKLGAAVLLAGLVLAQTAMAQDKEPVVLGFVTGLTGTGAETGQRVVNIGRMFAEMKNAGGGIDGRKVELVIGDSEDQPDILVSLGKRYLLQNNVTGFFGVGSSASALAFSRAVRNSRVPICLNDTWGNDNTSPDLPSVFRVGPYNNFVATLLAKFLVEKKYAHVAVLAEQSPFGTDFAKALERSLKDSPVQVQIVDYEPQTLDLGPTLLQLAQAETKPDALVVAGVYQAIFNLQNQAPEVGLKTQIIGSWDYPTTPPFWTTAGQNGVGVMYSTFSGPSVTLTPSGEAFRTAFHDKFQRDPIYKEYFLWDCLNALGHAVEASGSVDRATVAEAMANVDFEGSMRQIRFSSDPEPGTYHTALTGTLFIKQFTEVNQSGDDAPVVGTATP